jgi:hypothetical protein
MKRSLKILGVAFALSMSTLVGCSSAAADEPTSGQDNDLRAAAGPVTSKGTGTVMMDGKACPLGETELWLYDNGDWIVDTGSDECQFVLRVRGGGSDSYPNTNRSAHSRDDLDATVDLYMTTERDAHRFLSTFSGNDASGLGVTMLSGPRNVRGSAKLVYIGYHELAFNFSF